MRLAWSVAAALVLGLGAVPAAEAALRVPGGLEDCSGGPPAEALEGFSPLAGSGTKTVNSNGWACYQLFLEPGFGFHGDLRVELSDGEGNRAHLEQHCELAGQEAVPVLGPGCGGASGSSPALVAGELTLTVTVTDLTLPAAVGPWKAGVTFGA